MLGTLYGIGVGPGDPELLTLKAIKILKKVSHIFAASSSKNDYSVALEIVKDYISDKVDVKFLSFPMTYDQEELETAWNDNCRQVIELLKAGKDVAFITIGDPLIYSTYIYLLKKVKQALPEAPIQTIPGITSFQAAAACCNLPIVEREEVMALVSGAQGVNHLEKVLGFCDTVVLLKVYRQMPKILETLKERSLENSICFVSRCGLDKQEVFYNIKDLDGKNPHYLSLMIVKKKGLKS